MAAAQRGTDRYPTPNDVLSHVLLVPVDLRGVDVAVAEAQRRQDALVALAPRRRSIDPQSNGRDEVACMQHLTSGELGDWWGGQGAGEAVVGALNAPELSFTACISTVSSPSSFTGSWKQWLCSAVDHHACSTVCRACCRRELGRWGGGCGATVPPPPLPPAQVSSAGGASLSMHKLSRAGPGRACTQCCLLFVLFVCLFKRSQFIYYWCN